MRVSVVSKKRTWHVLDLQKESEKMGIDLEVKDLKDLEKGIDDLGDVVLWRGNSMNKFEGGSAVISLIKESGRVVINQGVAEFPFVRQKLFQQRFAEKIPGVNTIETFTFADKESLCNAVEKGLLKFPFIQKPMVGARGEGVELIESQEMLDNQNPEYIKLVYQNFVKNKGDFRVLVLGGRPLGAMKRVAKEGGFLNNFSKGGFCFVVENEDIKENICKMAVKIASGFKLAFCGVDIIFDEEKKEYLFLEVNTLPQWRGFRGVTGINVPRELLNFFKMMHEKKSRKTRSLVAEYYENNLASLNFDKSFHYLSRLFLWEDRKEFETELEHLKKDFIGEDEDEILENFKKVFSETEKYSDKLANGVSGREKYKIKYPLLGAYNRILFQALLSKTVYKKDVVHIVLKVLDEEHALRMRNELMKDEEALKTLSTHAINFLYLAQEIFGETFTVDSEELHEISLSDFGNQDEDLLLKIYFLTHCIIGESRFYSQPVNDEKGVYMEMIKSLEKIIGENYFKINLDNKMEFLVCAKMCGFESSIEKILIAEAENSMSDIGNFIVDSLNVKGKNKGKKDFWDSEHRNVLYLMATSKLKKW